MGHEIPNTFTTYALTEGEALQGSILNELQKQNLRNQQANIAEDILRLDYDPEHPLKFVQNESFLKGQLAIIAVLLDSSDVSEEELANPKPPED